MFSRCASPFTSADERSDTIEVIPYLIYSQGRSPSSRKSTSPSSRDREATQASSVPLVTFRMTVLLYVSMCYCIISIQYNSDSTICRFLKSQQSKESQQSEKKADGNDFLYTLSGSEGSLAKAAGIAVVKIGEMCPNFALEVRNQTRPCSESLASQLKPSFFISF